MENNTTENNEQEPIFIREESESSNGLWYWVIAVLALILIGWYGYTAGWFSERVATNEEIMIPVESDGGIGDGAVALNAAPIENIRIETRESFPVQQVVVVSGNLNNGCMYLNEPVQTRDGNIFSVELTTYSQGELCTQALVPYEEEIVLEVNNLPAGVYIVNVNGREMSFELENDNVLDFNAGEGK